MRNILYLRCFGCVGGLISNSYILKGDFCGCRTPQTIRIFRRKIVEKAKSIRIKGLLASAKLRSLVEIILARPIRGQDFKFSFNVIFLSTTDVNYVGDEVDPRPALQEVDQHV